MRIAVFRFWGVASLIACAAGVVSPTVADEMTPERRAEVLRSAVAAFDEAVSAARSDPPRARKLYRESAAGLSALAAGGLRSGALEYNLANAHYRLGEVGQAVLHYRRALRYGYGGAKPNLEYVRKAVTPFIRPPAEDQLAHSILFLHYRTSPSTRLWLCAGASLFGWALLYLWLRRRARWALYTGGAGVLVGLTLCASVALQLRAEAREPEAVVLTGEQTLRLGRGEMYEPAIRELLGAGVELRVLELRGDWVRVRLTNGQGGWIPAAAVEEV